MPQKSVWSYACLPRKSLRSKGTLHADRSASHTLSAPLLFVPLRSSSPRLHGFTLPVGTFCTRSPCHRSKEGKIDSPSSTRSKVAFHNGDKKHLGVLLLNWWRFPDEKVLRCACDTRVRCEMIVGCICLCCFDCPCSELAQIGAPHTPLFDLLWSSSGLRLIQHDSFCTC